MKKYIVAFLVGFFGECIYTGVREGIADIKESERKMAERTASLRNFNWLEG